MFDLKVINSVLTQLEEERGIPPAKILEAIEAALATAYKKEYGKKGQIVRATFDVATGKTEFLQVKIVVDDTRVIMGEELEKAEADPEAYKEDERVKFNPEHHILLDDAKKIKKDAALDDEIIFPLESKGDYGRIAAQTAKQVIIQKIREAEKISVLTEYGKREGEIVSGTVQRTERGNVYLDLGRANGILPYEEQIPGEHYRQGERVRAYLYSVEESPRGIFLRLSRSHPKFLEELFKIETPEIASGVVTIKAVAREAGSRSKVAVASNDPHIDPVGSMVGQRGVRVSTVMSELGGEKIDIIEWSAEAQKFVEDSLSPAKVLSVEMHEADKKALVRVSEDQQSLAIGKGGQNVRLAAKLTGWRIDIQSAKGIIAAEGAAEVMAEEEKYHADMKTALQTAVAEYKNKENTEEPAKSSGESKKKKASSEQQKI
ncbi:MAG: transcription termination factor NusA [Candidatus Taylorbacteria bacterium RIFCSPLOWO2_01_FULL_45_15b]|uniref:Transcription termination/antitermination protein NusA n=1 Tax=Candidatus Taylorbacteria bacterium RIFCSPLOWO2_01_FULL_45_15b TaxID=1802319 RepID=A0A1G2NC12_9BACT|nr:MAG: transcription termination factor NusA [Candidatus Taylorbacteria bacterium RIFCSPLOWO2_01_FULL_45_15b]